jgi:uncharacterized protein
MKMTSYCFLAVAAFAATACNMSEVSKAESVTTVKELPQQSFIVDQADLLTPEKEDVLFTRLSAARKIYGPHLIIMTVKSLNGQPIEDYSLKMANYLGIGDAKRDDGLVLLVAPNERKVRIEVGHGLEGSFSDQVCAKIIDDAILPQFRKARFSEGIFAGVDQMIAKMRTFPTIPVNDNIETEQQKVAG